MSADSMLTQLLAVEVAVMLRLALQAMHDGLEASITDAQVAQAEKRENPTLRHQDGVRGHRYAFIAATLFLSTGTTYLITGPAPGNAWFFLLLLMLSLILVVSWIQLSRRAACIPPIPRGLSVEHRRAWWTLQDTHKYEINAAGDAYFTLAAALTALLALSSRLIPGG